nr:hypothetical protein B0A51_00111 [Rachicladosporium sp. CCFEE 5018]
MNSHYGPLTGNGTDQFRGVLPTLRFDKADVLLQLSADPKDSLFVHSEILAAASPMLKIELTGWGDANAHADTLIHPRSREKVAVKGWPKVSHGANNATHAAIAIHLLVALIYGIKLDHWDLFPRDAEIRFLIDDLSGNLSALMTTTAAYAGYFACLPMVREAIARLLVSVYGYWIPAHALLAMKLKSTWMYCHATRDLVMRANRYLPSLNARLLSTRVFWEDVAGVLEVVVAEAFDTYSPRQPEAQSDRKLPELDLRNADYHRGRWEYGTGSSARSTFVEVLRLVRHRLFDCKNCAAETEFFARLTYTQWLIDELYRLHLKEDGPKARLTPAARLNRAVQRVHNASFRFQPAGMLRQGEDTLPSLFMAFGETQSTLAEATKNAISIIRGKLAESFSGPQASGAKLVKSDWPEYLYEPGYDVEQSAAVDPCISLKPLDISITPASNEWLDVVFAANPVATTYEGEDERPIRPLRKSTSSARRVQAPSLTKMSLTGWMRISWRRNSRSGEHVRRRRMRLA